MNQSIVRVGYDPFESSYDAHDPTVVGGLFGSIAKGVASVAKSAAVIATTPIRATARLGVNLSQGKFSAAASGLWNDNKNALRHAMKISTGKPGRYALIGAAMVFPPAAPAVAGVIAAGQVLKNLDSKKPAVRRAAATVLAATQQHAKVNPGAKRAWAATLTAQGLLRKGIPVGIKTHRAPAMGGPAPRQLPARASTGQASAGMLFTATGQAIQGQWVRA